MCDGSFRMVKLVGALEPDNPASSEEYLGGELDQTFFKYVFNTLSWVPRI